MVIWSLQISWNVQSVHINGVSPASAQLVGLAFSIRSLGVGSTWSTVCVVTTTPTTVLQGKVLVAFTGDSAGFLLITVLLWSEIEITVTVVCVATNPLVVLRDVLTVLINGVGQRSSKSDVGQVIVYLISEFTTFLIRKLWVKVTWKSIVVIAGTESKFWVVVGMSLQSEEWVVTLLTSSLALCDIHTTSLWSLDEISVIG